jgi:pimeloyl-ACP methyl ester carboxylesterase
MFAPWMTAPSRTVRRGHFWIAGDRLQIGGLTYQRGPMFVEWEAPEVLKRPFPLILMHGGGFQGTEWFDTPDGRPGWAQRLVEAGYAVLVVDRPGHGRSPFHVATMGSMTPPFSYENGRKIYFPESRAAEHTQWPFARDDEASMDSFIAGYGPMPADLAMSEEMDAARTAQLLEMIGPAILFTHSASGPSGWLTADRCPGLLKAIVAIEPMGPPFANIPNIGSLTWGLAACPLTYDPPLSTPEAVRTCDPAAHRLTALEGLPILVVTAAASDFAAAGAPAVERLRAGGAAAEILRLSDHGVYGNGHGLIYEKNSDEALRPVLTWLESLALEQN